MDQNICLSGGAIGADQQWGMVAGTFGHMVVHFGFDGHRSQVPDHEKAILSDQQLKEANERLKAAGRMLGRHPPKNPFVRKLIQRNYYQVEWTSKVYAVSTIEDDFVTGGTAWAIAMARHRDPDIPTYVYCQEANGWFVWEDMWVACSDVPVPTGIWTGIGSRNLTQEGKMAIRDLFGWKREMVKL